MGIQVGRIGRQVGGQVGASAICRCSEGRQVVGRLVMQVGRWLGRTEVVSQVGKNVGRYVRGEGSKGWSRSTCSRLYYSCIHQMYDVSERRHLCESRGDMVCTYMTCKCSGQYYHHAFNSYIYPFNFFKQLLTLTLACLRRTLTGCWSNCAKKECFLFQKLHRCLQARR